MIGGAMLAPDESEGSATGNGRHVARSRPEHRLLVASDDCAQHDAPNTERQCPDVDNAEIRDVDCHCQLLIGH